MERGVSCIRPLSGHDWSDITGIQRSAAGSTGVYFIETGNREVCVVKGIPETEFLKDRFVFNFAREYFGINTPKLRLLKSATPEYQHMEAAVRSLFAPLHDEKWHYGYGGQPSPLVWSYFRPRASA
jgi:hypothetical protein